MTESFQVDPAHSREFRDSLGRFATGVTVVTIARPHGPFGITVNSFASVSLNPPLVLWSPSKHSLRHDQFAFAPFFAIHVLAEHQQDLAKRFTRHGSAFDGLETQKNAEGVEIIPDTLARFECALHSTQDAGDHSLVLGRVLRAYQQNGAPLVFSQGEFGGFREAK